MINVTGTLINLYQVCKRETWLHANGIRMEHTSDVVTEGKLVHETSYPNRAARYEEGVCYYKADILSNGKAEIVRNNVYKLKVTGIAKLGLPEPKDEPKLATLKLSVEVEPWTIQTNNFEFK